MEIWKPIPRYEGRYEASDEGRVRAVKASRLFPAFHVLSHNMSGKYRDYHYVGMGKKKFGVHRLVMAAFRGWPLNNETVNHIDGDKDNNRLSNLEYCSHTENVRHGYRTGLIPTGPRLPSGECHPRALITDEQALTIIAMLAAGQRPVDIIRTIGTTKDVVYQIKRGATWRHLPR